MKKTKEPKKTTKSSSAVPVQLELFPDPIPLFDEQTQQNMIALAVGFLVVALVGISCFIYYSL